MPAAHIRIEVAGGLDAFHCPACGTGVFSPDQGFVEGCCPHFRLFVDWVGEVWLAEPEDLPEAARASQEAVWRVWLETGGDVQAALPRWAEALPASAVLLSLVEPWRGGGHEESRVVVGLDLAA